VDFNSLVSIIIETTENDGSEFVGALPAMIQRAQEKMQNDLDDQGLVTYASVAVSASSAEVSVPVGGEIIKTFSIEVGGSRTQLKHRPYEYLLDYWPVSASTGTPRYYGFKTNTEIRVAPTPSATVDSQIGFIAQITTITSASPTNYFTTHCENALFYSSMIEASLFMKSFNTTQAWQQEYQSEVDRLRNRARRSRQDDMQTSFSPAGGPNTLVKGSD
jgi:hypothetical protein|tara:strand:- start:2893 stop:3546 length:654 start_codon:yes stop_codon:yes gene_type:complete